MNTQNGSILKRLRPIFFVAILFSILITNSQAQTESDNKKWEDFAQSVKLQLEQREEGDTSLLFIQEAVEAYCAKDLECQLNTYLSFYRHDLSPPHDYLLSKYLILRLIATGKELKDPVLEGQWYLQLSITEGNFNHQLAASQALDRAIQLFEQSGNQKKYLVAKFNRLKRSLEQYRTMEEVLPQIREIEEQVLSIPDTVIIQYIYQSMIIYLVSTDRYDLIKVYVQQLEEVLPEEESMIEYGKRAAILNGKIAIAVGNRRNAEARFYLKQAIKAANEAEDFYNVAGHESYIAELYVQEGQIDSAEYFLTVAYQRSRDLNAHALLTRVYALKSQIAEIKGEYQQALQFKIKELAHLDSLKAPSKDFNLRAYHLELEKQQLNAQKAQREAQFRYSLIILALFLVLFIGMVYAFLQQRKARQRLALQNQTIQQQAEELKSLERLKSRFFANVSHELRTPLTLLLGPINTLLSRKKEVNEESQLLQFAQRNANHLLKLINEILDLSKLESGKLKVEEEVTKIGPFLHQLLAQFQSYATSVRVQLRTELNLPVEPELLIDKNKVEKIIQNFLSNAIKFTPPEGQVTLKATTQKEQIQISVQDTGTGIHPEDLPHIFDRFYQSKHNLNTPKGGTGIGLSLCQELAELIGGRVWAESIFGKGSTFYFEFPIKVATPSTLNPQPSTIPPPAPLTPTVPAGRQEGEPQPAPNISTPQHFNTSTLKPSTILLVEDNPDLRDYIKILLPEYNILTAENGQAALENIQHLNISTTQQLNLIISDLMMPVMDGFEFLDQVKANDRLRHIPFIMLTAKVNIKAKLHALRVGVDDYIHKPFQEIELKARIENLLRNYRERMVLFSENTEQDDQNPSTSPPVINQADSEWLQQVEQTMEQFLPEYNLKMDRVADELFLSHRQFSRRLKSLTGLTPSQYLKEMRLARAKELLAIGQYQTVKEVAFAVGFTDARYFSDLFQKHSGSRPSRYFSS